MSGNSFPMKEWHIQHMEKTVIKYIKGLPENATAWEKRQHRRYGGITRVCRQINYDIKHGVTNNEIQMFLKKIDSDSSFIDLRNKEGFKKRFLEIEDFMIKCK